jgi:SAM-dependent methyltransferase
MNRAKLQMLLARAHYDVSSAQTAGLVALGARLGLYERLADGARTLAELAADANVDTRYLQPWLVNQVASGYVSFDPGTDRYSLDDEQREVFTDGGGKPLAPAFELAVELLRQTEKLEAAMRSGGGIDAGLYGERAHDALGRLDPGKGARAVAWLHAAGAAERLAGGGSLVEIGCGRGATLRMLQSAFPQARLAGIDIDTEALVHVADAGIRALSEVPVEERFDVALTLETLHETAKPEAFALMVYDLLTDDGLWIAAEPLAADGLAANHTPAGRYLASLELLYCLPTSLAAGGAGLGPLTGPDAYEALLRHAGFTRLRRLEDPERLVIEARK